MLRYYRQIKTSLMHFALGILLVTPIVLLGCGSSDTTVSDNYTSAVISQAEFQTNQTFSANEAPEPKPAMEAIDAAEVEQEIEHEPDSGSELVTPDSDFTESSTTTDEESETENLGRILFIGDSRTIDMFADSDKHIYGDIHDGIVVYGGHGKGLAFMRDSVNEFGWDNFDTLVSWMGANEKGDFGDYGSFYDEVLGRGKRLIVCTVGPTCDDYLDEEDIGSCEDYLMQQFNADLISYANSHDVQIIDLYTFTKDNIEIDPADGVHYLPRPTSALWSFILENLNL